MAVRALAKQTPAQRALADRVRRARPPAAEYDADIYAQAADLARRHDVEPSTLFDEIEDRAAAIALIDNVGTGEAIAIAWRHVLGRYER